MLLCYRIIPHGVRTPFVISKIIPHPVMGMKSELYAYARFFPADSTATNKTLFISDGIEVLYRQQSWDVSIIISQNTSQKEYYAYKSYTLFYSNGKWHDVF